MSTEDHKLALALDQALEGEPNAEQLSVLREALELRLQTSQRLIDAEEDPQARQMLERDLKKLRQQIETLQEEEAITRFIEDSVQFVVRHDQMMKENGS
jgi:hypothetical protein